MAKKLDSSDRINLVSSFSFCVAVVCLLNIHYVSGTQCGMANLFADERMLNGAAVRDGEWPFIAALYLTASSQYFCGGTIISRKHVLTAAHCIQQKSSSLTLSKEDIEVRLGAYNLTVLDEKHAVRRNVADIQVHGDWKVNEDNYNADIAILELSDNVTFSDRIRPICLPPDDAVVDSAFINIAGVIVGWGIDQKKTYEPIPKSAVIQALNDSYCFLTYTSTVYLASPHTFCGIGVATPNRGDSGGGFFVDTGLVWAQYGIISAIRTNDDHQVFRTAAVYTNVQSYRKWIVERLGQYAVDSRITKINLQCTFETDGTGYACFLRNLDIRTENNDVEFFTGSHESGKSDEDVTWIYFDSGTMLFLPNGVGQSFRNLETLVVSGGMGTKLIAGSNLQNLEKLKGLQCENNAIGILEFDSLWELPALKYFMLKNNKLKVLDARTFKKNTKLTHVDLRSNRLEYLPRNIFKANPLLHSVDLDFNRLKNIKMKFYTLTNIQHIHLQGNVCIDTCYSRSDRSSNDDLVEFQSFMWGVCSPTDYK